MIRFALTIFISAFLLFQIQPIIGRYILPWYGGSSAVWITCLLFFQILLLSGYCYAHLLRVYLKNRHQAIVHIALIIIALFLLPIAPDAGLKPESPNNPITSIWIILLLTVGLPYFLISASGPLLQHWFRQQFPNSSPYRLYALSNIGSLIALLTYPFLVEPLFNLKYQSWIWSAGFFIYVVVCISCAYPLKKISNGKESNKSNRRYISVNRSDYFLWIFLSASASILLMASTNQICQDIASFPFLWLLPLSLYLLSFIICFDKSKWYDRRVWVPIFLISILFGIYCLILDHTSSIQFQIFVYSSILFCGCMVCHGEMVRIKPHPEYLTKFYLLISLGGALGGVFVILIAPLLFNGYWELQLIWCVILILLGICIFKQQNKNSYWINISLQLGWATLCACYGIVLMSQIYYWDQNTIDIKRGFYGVLRVQEIKSNEDDDFHLVERRLMHGSILHGNQIINNEYIRSWPMTYFGYNSGIGLAIHEHPKYGLKRVNNNEFRIGVIGMGVATIAALATKNDVVRFYEINPEVVKLSNKYFSYLQDTLARWDVVLGDARISMEQELAMDNKQNFDVLAVDAFSGDAIPVHLLTIESFKLYWQHLNEDGILAVHITNRHLELFPIVKEAAQSLNKSVIVIEMSDNEDTSTLANKWVLMTDNNIFLQRDNVVIRSSNITATESVSMWTDDYSNLFSVIK